MATIKFKLDKRHANTKGIPVQFVLVHKQNNTTIGTGISVGKESEFIGYPEKIVSGRFPNAKNINEALSQLYFQYTNAIMELSRSGKINSMSVVNLKEYLLDGGKKYHSKNTFTDYATDYVSKITNAKTKYLYTYTLSLVESFFDKNVAFEEITAGTLRAMDDQWSKTMGINTRSIHFRNIRTIFNRAIDDDICGQDNYPFRKFKIKEEYKEKEFLPVDDFRNLLTLSFTPQQKTLEMARDLFVLSFCFCGANPADLFKLEKPQNNKICFVRQKTAGKGTQPIRILIQPEAKKIIERYSGEDTLLNYTEHYIDYKNFYHTIRLRIKSIGEMIGQPNLTLYWARYSWASYADKIGIDEKVISKSLGHSDVSLAGKRYISYDWERTDKANRKVIDYLLNRGETK